MKIREKNYLITIFSDFRLQYYCVHLSYLCLICKH